MTIIVITSAITIILVFVCLMIWKGDVDRFERFIKTGDFLKGLGAFLFSFAAIFGVSKYRICFDQT